MKIVKSINLQGNNFRAAIVGLLGAFTFFVLKELIQEPLLFLIAIISMVVAVLLAKKTAQHFHAGHTHAGDSPLDVVAVSVLFLANILHPAVDGFSIHQIFTNGGIVAGGVFVGGVILHEVFRQSALVPAFKAMGVGWYWVVSTAVVGIGLGIGMGVIGSYVLDKHEGVIDIATVFAYTFIISEFYAVDHGFKKNTPKFVLAGIVIGTILSLFVNAH